MAIVMQKVMGASGAESLNVAASIFMGQTEAPLTIRPFLAGLTESELFTIMVSGMAHVSGAVMAAYVVIAHVEIRHLLTAVIMTAPATIMLAKILVPEVDTPVTAGKVEVEVEKPGVNIIDAAAHGAGDGLHLALNIGAMLIAFLALIALCNGMLGGFIRCIYPWLPGRADHSRLHVRARGLADGHHVSRLRDHRKSSRHTPGAERVRGVPGLGQIGNQSRPQSFTIATYALCGFANFSSIAIQIGGIGALAPQPQVRSGAAGLESGRSRHHGQLYVGLHRGNAVVMRRCRYTIASHSNTRSNRGSLWCWAAAWRIRGRAGEFDSSPTRIFGLPQSTAVGHSGKVGAGPVEAFGCRGDVGAIPSLRRLHAGTSDVGVRVLHRLGVRSMVLTNAAGGINLSL